MIQVLYQSYREEDPIRKEMKLQGDGLQWAGALLHESGKFL